MDDQCGEGGFLADPEEPLRGRGLRYILIDELRRRPEMTVADMVASLSGHGFRFGGRASKVISDALRWEVRAGRVCRIRRGVYRFVGANRSRMRRVVLFATTCHRWVTAHQADGAPPPFPANTRPPLPLWWFDTPTRPPWAHLGWLWTS